MGLPAGAPAPRAPSLRVTHLRPRALRAVAALLAVGLAAGCHHHAPPVATSRAEAHTRAQRAPLHVMVYNIHAGKDAQEQGNLPRVAQLILGSRADIALLQEVDRNTERSGHVDQVAELERLTGMHGILGKSLDYQGGDYGIAILSRWPITSDTTVHLPVEPVQVRAGGSTEPRVALVVHVAAPFGDLAVVNTHLDPSGRDTFRLQEVHDLLEMLRPIGASGTRALVGGDFNSTPDSRVQETLRSAGLTDLWVQCGRGQPLTYPADTPAKRIDYLFSNWPVRCAEARVLDTQASDHRPVLFSLIPQSP